MSTLTLPAVAPERPAGTDVVVVRPDAEVLGRQCLPYFLGVSAASTGATGISMNLVIVPPGGAAEPHSHRGFETAVFVVEGRVHVRHGHDLAESTFIGTGDFLFIPADVPHQPVNLSATEPAICVVARNDPQEQESIELFHPQGPQP